MDGRGSGRLNYGESSNERRVDKTRIKEGYCNIMDVGKGAS